MIARLRLAAVIACLAMASSASRGTADPGDGTAEIQFPSSVDHSPQPALLWTPQPKAGDSQPRPLLVFLHSWSGDWKQDNSAWLKQAQQRGWIYLHPDFRGRNDHPEACGSRIARQDVLDSIEWAIRNRKVDESRIYLAGVSGGGHMAMLMAARYPERFSAVSSWVGISDLAEWHRFHTRDGRAGPYAVKTAACCGGSPGASSAVDQEYRDRSPIFWLQNVGDLPLDIHAGVQDGKTGSVPIHQSLRAFNVIADTGHDPRVSDAEMEELWRDGRLSKPRPSDIASDPDYGRELHLRRTAGQTRVTIFEGGHEGLPAPACQWLEQRTRPTRSPKPDNRKEAER